MKTQLFIIALLFMFQANAQQHLLLTNGKQIEISELKLDSLNHIFYKTQNGKIKWLNTDEVFSWTREDSVEVIFYKPECTDVCFKIEQMKDYLKGTADGRKHEAELSTVSGFAVGTVSGLFLAAYLTPILPAVTAGLNGAFKPKEEKLNIPEKYKDNLHYIEGYKKSVKQKRVINSIIGGSAGIIIGIFVRSL